MAWSLVGTATTGTAVASGNVTGTLPTGHAQGDVLLATINFRGTATFTPPTDWTLVGSQLTGDTLAAAGIAGIAQYICYRGASAPGTVWTRTGGDLGQVRISCFRSSLGAITTDRLRAFQVGQTPGQVAGGTASVLSPGITPDVDGCLIYIGASGADQGTWSSLETGNIPSVSFTVLGTSTGSATGADGTIHAARHVQASAAATGSVRGTLSIAGRNAFAIVAIAEPPPPSIPDAWNINDKNGAWTFSNGDKTVVSGGTAYVRTTQAWANEAAGKYYVEVRINVRSSTSALALLPISSLISGTVPVDVLLSSGAIRLSGSPTGLTIGAFVAGDIACLAWNAAAETIWFRRNGGLWNGVADADPASGTNGLDIAAVMAAGAIGLRYRGQASGEGCTVRTELAEFTQSVPSGFSSWMGEATGPGDLNVSGVQTTSAATQSATAALTWDDLVTEAGDFIVTEDGFNLGVPASAEAAINVSVAQTTQATAQSAAATVRVTATAVQTTQAATQTTAVTTVLAVSASQTLSAAAHAATATVRSTVTGAQPTLAATTSAAATTTNHVTGAQATAAAAQAGTVSLGPAFVNVSGAQQTAAVSQTLSASLGAPFLTVGGAQTTLASNSTATATISVTSSTTQPTLSATTSVTADVNLRVTGAQPTSLAGHSASAKAIAGVTGSQTLAAAITGATVGVRATLTGAQATLAAATVGTITAPPALAVTGAQQTRETSQTLSASLGLPFRTVTGLQETQAAGTAATATAPVRATAVQPLEAATSAATATVNLRVTGAQATLSPVSAASATALLQVVADQVLSPVLTAGTIGAVQPSGSWVNVDGVWVRAQTFVRHQGQWKPAATSVRHAGDWERAA